MSVVDRDYLAICAIMKDEGPYLREWLEFHKIVGVSRFYLYDNGSSDNTRQILAPYVKSGDVVLTDWPLHPGQIQAYNHCLKQNADRARWIAFIDLDEFLFGTKEDDLRLILRDYEQHCGVVVNWQIFGSSGHVVKPKGLVLENFIGRAPVDFRSNNLVKSIVNPAFAVRSVNPHAFVYCDSLSPVNESGTSVLSCRENKFGAFSAPGVGRLRINHYLVKSREEFEARRLKGRAEVQAIKSKSFFKAHDQNAQEDRTIQRFLPLLKERLAGVADALDIPADFDWQWYLKKYPNLRKNGIDSQEKAKRHWILHGKREGRLYREVAGSLKIVRTRPARILIMGQPKTGTSALFYKIKPVMPDNTQSLFEPPDPLAKLEKEPADRAVLCKIHFNHFSMNILSQLVPAFNKYIFIVRDPRDTLISMILWGAQHCEEDFNKIRDIYQLLCSFEKNDTGIGVVDLYKQISERTMFNSTFEKSVQLLRMFDPFIYKYEDMICGNDGALNDYLGVDIAADPESNKIINMVSRTRSAENWRRWFTPADVIFLQSSASVNEYLRYFGYEAQDWQLAAERQIDPQHCSEYFMRLVNDRRSHKGLSLLTSKELQTGSF